MRFSLFALGTFIGALLVTFAAELASQSVDVPVVEPVVALNPATGDEPDTNDFDAIAARNREIAERRAKLIDELAAREAVDPSWAPAMQRQMIEQFAAHAPKGATLVSVICKSSLCIAEVDSSSRRESTQQTGWSAMFGLQRGFVRNVETPIEGRYRSVVYLARDGHSLPK